MHIQQHIVFDFDGTIADTIDFALNTFNSVAAEFDLPELAEEDRKNVKEKGIREMLNLHKISKLKLTHILLRVKNEMGQSITEMKPIEGMETALRALKELGFSLGILTSNSQENVKEFLAVHNLSDLFDFIYSEKSLFGKSVVIKRMLKQEKIDKNSIIYVGDETRDIEACQKAGIPIIAVTWGLNGKQALNDAKPDRIAEKPGELLDFAGEMLTSHNR